MTRGKTYGNYPAAQAIMSCVYEGIQTTFDTGLVIETRYFTQLMLDPVARNMVRTLFINMQEANKLVRRPSIANIPKTKVEKIGILGAGLMGAGVAYISAKAGMQAARAILADG